MGCSDQFASYEPQSKPVIQRNRTEHKSKTERLLALMESMEPEDRKRLLLLLLQKNNI